MKPKPKPSKPDPRDRQKIKAVLNDKPPFQQKQPKALEDAIASINKDYGDGSVIRMTGLIQKVDVIPTGNPAIDHALGVGGVPRGRIVELYGPESGGKTTIASSVIAQAQEMGITCLFVDVEHAFDPTYAAKLGVDMSTLLFSQPDSGEEALTIVERFASTGCIGLAVVDSVAGMATKQEIEGEMGDAAVGAKARLMGQGLRKLTPILSKTNTCCIFINQIRDKVGVIYGSPETTPGGKALKFAASIRMDVRKIGVIKGADGQPPVGSRTRIKVVKNKVAPPFREVEFDIIFGEGISGYGSLVDLAIQLNVLQKRGSWIAYEGTQLAQGRDAAKDALKEDPMLALRIEEQVREAFSKTNSLSVNGEETSVEIP